MRKIEITDSQTKTIKKSPAFPQLIALALVWTAICCLYWANRDEPKKLIQIVQLPEVIMACAAGEFETDQQFVNGGTITVPADDRNCATPWVALRPGSGGSSRPEGWIERQLQFADGTVSDWAWDGPTVTLPKAYKPVGAVRFRNTGERTGDMPVVVVIQMPLLVQK